MENYEWSRPGILNGTYVGRGLRAEKGVQNIAVEDVAAFAALAFANPKEYVGKTIELSGDELTESQIAKTFAKVIGRPVGLVKPTPGAGRRSEEEMRAMFDFFNADGYGADIEALRKLHPGLLTLEQYLRRHGWENAQPIPMAEKSGRG
jgi:uncharacterized protein YbjT (DUF2867 family)